MTAPELPESNINPNYRSPRETCTHERTVKFTQKDCAIKRSVTVCVQCGLVVE